MKSLQRTQLLLVGAMLFFAAMYFYQEPGWNGNTRLALVRAIVERGSLQIDAYWKAPGWITEDAAFFNGHYYSDKAPGSALLALPFYWIIYHIAQLLHLQLGTDTVKQLLTIPIVGLSFAIGGMSMYRIAGRLGAPPPLALTSTLAIALGTMLWPYSAVFYGHVIAAAFLIVAFDLLHSMRLSAGELTPRRFFVVGLVIGMAFIVEYTAALIILGLFGYALYVVHAEPPRRLFRLALAALAGALIPLSIMLAYNAAIYGNPFALGYAHETSDTFSQGMAGGLMGISLPRRSALYHITLDPRFGLLWLSPVLLLAPIGYFMAIRRGAQRLENLVSLYAIGVMLLMNAGYYLWWGGAAFGPRLIIPGLPFLVVPLAMLPRRLEPAKIGLGIVSIAQMLIPLLGMIQPLVGFRPNRNAFYADNAPFNGFSLLYQHGLPLIAQRYEAGIASWTLASGLHLPYVLAVPLLVAVEAVLLLWFLRLTRTPEGAGSLVQEAAAHAPAPGG